MTGRPPAGGETVATAVHRLLSEHGVAFEERRHQPVRSAEEAAAARGTPLAMGAKTIVFKVDDWFGVFALSAAHHLSARLLRHNLGARRTRFASREELAALTGLVPGTVPPFGEPVLPLPLYADPALLEQPTIAFTPGVADRSILLRSDDWLRVAQPTLVPFSREAKDEP